MSLQGQVRSWSSRSPWSSALECGSAGRAGLALMPPQPPASAPALSCSLRSLWTLKAHKFRSIHSTPLSTLTARGAHTGSGVFPLEGHTQGRHQQEHQTPVLREFQSTVHRTFCELGSGLFPHCPIWYLLASDGN